MVFPPNATPFCSEKGVRECKSDRHSLAQWGERRGSGTARLGEGRAKVGPPADADVDADARDDLHDDFGRWTHDGFLRALRVAFVT